jgi:hypothetical protein
VAVPFPGQVTLKLYNLRGEAIWRKDFQAAAPQQYPVAWDCRNESGMTVSYGDYYLAAEEKGDNSLFRRTGRWISVLH